MRAKLGTKRANTLKIPRKDLNPVTFEIGLSFSLESVPSVATSHDPDLSPSVDSLSFFGRKRTS